MLIYAAYVLVRAWVDLYSIVRVWLYIWEAIMYVRLGLYAGSYHTTPRLSGVPPKKCISILIPNTATASQISVYPCRYNPGQ